MRCHGLSLCPNPKDGLIRSRTFCFNTFISGKPDCTFRSHTNCNPSSSLEAKKYTRNRPALASSTLGTMRTAAMLAPASASVVVGAKVDSSSC